MGDEQPQRYNERYNLRQRAPLYFGTKKKVVSTPKVNVKKSKKKEKLPIKKVEVETEGKEVKQNKINKGIQKVKDYKKKANNILSLISEASPLLKKVLIKQQWAIEPSKESDKISLREETEANRLIGKESESNHEAESQNNLEQEAGGEALVNKDLVLSGTNNGIWPGPYNLKSLEDLTKEFSNCNIELEETNKRLEQLANETILPSSDSEDWKTQSVFDLNYRLHKEELDWRLNNLRKPGEGRINLHKRLGASGSIQYNPWAQEEVEEQKKKFRERLDFWDVQSIISNDDDTENDIPNIPLDSDPNKNIRSNSSNEYQDAVDHIPKNFRNKGKKSKSKKS